MSLTLFFAMAMSMAQGDPVESARAGYNACLTTYTNEALEAKKTPAEFTKAVGGACATEKTKLLEAMVKSEMQYGGKKADAESYAAEETQMIVDSYVGSYGDYLSSNTRHGKG
ncbi:hypothetical protein [Blastomonas sp.]|uniref:hypothetical protein n=1 Tax=Blastomonas sp. TaxID=1909299 RepID=UPI003919EE81